MTNPEVAADNDWAFIGALCRGVERDLTSLVSDVVTSIQAELPAYAAVSRAEHEEMVREEFQGLFTGLAMRRLPTAAEAEHGRLLGRRRAEQGVPVESVLGAYHVGYRQIWDILLGRANDEDPLQAARLLGLVHLVWAWLRVITSAAAEGYAEATRAREETRIGLAHQFLEALYSGATAEPVGLLARALAFDPQGEFQVICCPAAPWTPEGLDGLRRRLRANPGTACAVVRGTVLVVVLQDTTAASVLDLLRQGAAQPIAGVGLARPGLAGAAAALADAERALAVSRRRGEPVLFDADWLAATLLPHMDRLRPLMDVGIAVRQQHHLCEAVRAYAEHRFSITASARALHVHPNTVKYRLDRWRDLTGWDPRTLDGLLRSLLGVTLLPEPGYDTPATG